MHSIAVDSQGNIYTTETYEGKRIQKFVNKGLAPVTQDAPGHGLADDAVILWRLEGWRLESSSL